MNTLKSAFFFPFLGVTWVLISVLIRHVRVCVLRTDTLKCILEDIECI